MDCYRQRGGDNGSVNDGSDPSKSKLVSYSERREIINIRSFFLLFRSGMKFSAGIPFFLGMPERPGIIRYSNRYETSTFLYRLKRRCEIFRPYRLVQYELKQWLRGSEYRRSLSKQYLRWPDRQRWLTKWCLRLPDLRNQLQCSVSCLWITSTDRRWGISCHRTTNTGR